MPTSHRPQSEGAPPTILVVEDVEDLRVLLQRMFEREGYRVVGSASAAEAMADFERISPDVVVLDVGLPDQSGFAVMAALRRSSDVPILMLTGLGTMQDRVRGLDAGADDYLVKPASQLEVAARVRALLRRRRRNVHHRLRDADCDLEIDLAARTVERSGMAVTLTRLEFDLLVYLLQHAGVAVSRDEILRDVWSSSPDYQVARVVTEYVGRLRHKLGALPVTSLRGVGYRYDGTPKSW